MTVAISLPLPKKSDPPVQILLSNVSTTNQKIPQKMKKVEEKLYKILKLRLIVNNVGSFLFF